MIVLSPEEMQQVDQKTITNGFPEILLMETAGRGTAQLVDESLENKTNKDQQITIFTGKGNNGGDGFVVARFLDMWGYDVQLICMGGKDDLQGVTLINFELCEMRNITIKSFDQIDKQSLKTILNNTELVVDALLGTGLSGNVRGNYKEVIKLINKTDALVIAVDIPSGINGKTGQVQGVAVKADFTATMAFLKLGLTIYPGREYCGKTRVVDLGMPDSSLNNIGYNHFTLNEKEASNMLPERDITGHKGTFGKIGVIGGAPGMSGAPAMTGMAALRTGTGLVSAIVPRNIQPVVASNSSELITQGINCDKEGICLEAFSELTKMKNEFDIMAMGPGLSQSAEVKLLVEKMIERFDLPLVLDADGINAINNPEILKERKSPLILTPHPGEMARLIDKEISEIQSNRIKISRSFAQEYNTYLILKGAATVVALPDGDIYINQTGNQGMATAGSGDVLTGIVCSLLGQGLSPRSAVILAPYIHGLAGDLAVENIGFSGLIAGDIIQHIPEAVKSLHQRY